MELDASILQGIITVQTEFHLAYILIQAIGYREFSSMWALKIIYED